MEFSGLIPALKTGNVDLILSSMTATDERRKSIDFSNPYAFTGLALLVRKDSDIQSIEDLKKPGRTHHRQDGDHRRDLGHQEPARMPSAWSSRTRRPACWKSPRAGRMPSSTTSSASINTREENKETTRGLLKPFVEESWALGIAKGNDALRQQVNAFLDEFRKEDGFEKLGERYLKEEKKFLEAAGDPVHPPLRIRMTRRQLIANALVALALVALFGWLCTTVFAVLGTQTDWSKAWEYRETLWRGWLMTLGNLLRRAAREHRLRAAVHARPALAAGGGALDVPGVPRVRARHAAAGASAIRLLRDLRAADLAAAGRAGIR